MDRAETHERTRPLADDRHEEVTDARRDAPSPGGVDVEARWQVTQSRFLESPREAVGAADELVADVLEDLRRRLDAERAEVAQGWQHDDVGTEDLRRAMLRYREVLDRLLARTG